MSPQYLAIVVALDFLLGDPRWCPHPVRWIGLLIQKLEKQSYPNRRSKNRELIAGSFFCSGVIIITCLSGSMAIWLAHSLLPPIEPIARIVLGFYCISARSLAQEASVVYRHLAAGQIESARTALSMIVGRDTRQLNESEIARATVETVGENIIDGIVSPLLYLAILGPVAALFFKAVSTMDSMVGYRNSRYRYFGTCAARLDDVLNFIPARLGAFLLIPLGALGMGYSPVAAWRCVVRDRHNHPSPNAAHGESAIAGLLHIELGGEATYFGKKTWKPKLNQGAALPDAQTIQKTVRFIYTTTFASLACFAGLASVIG